MNKISSQLNPTPELLGTSDVIITEVNEDQYGSIYIIVESTQSNIFCRHCQRPTEAYGYDRTLTSRHLPMFGREVYIKITPPRGICKQCNKDPTTTQTLFWFNRHGHHTKPYDDYLMLQMIGSTQRGVARKERLTEEIIQGMMDRYIQSEVDWKLIRRIGLLGIDEIALKKGHQDYVTLVTGRYENANQILAVIRGKEKASIQAFLCSISKKKRKTIAAACVDMYDNYIEAAKAVFGDSIPIIVDRFHVVKLYRREITKLRSQELKRLKKELTKEEYRLLHPVILIHIKKQEFYSKKEKTVLAPLFNLSPATKTAYLLARELTIIYNTRHKKETAERKMKAWVAKVESSSVSCSNKFTKTLARYETYISNYFIRRETSGWIEGISNKVKVIKRRCYGILNVKHFFQRLFLDLRGYNVLLNKQMVKPC